MSRLPFPVALLTLVYVTVLGSLDPWDLVLGAAMSLGMVLLFRRLALPTRPTPVALYPARLLWFIVFAGAIAWEVTLGAWTVLGVVLRIRPMRRSGIVLIPVESSTRSGVAVSALVVTISPGTYLLDLDRERRVMLIHALDASDPDSLRDHFHRFYERFQRNVFP